MLITSNYNTMGGAEKTVIHIPKLRVRQYLKKNQFWEY